MSSITMKSSDEASSYGDASPLYADGSPIGSSIRAVGSPSASGGSATYAEQLEDYLVWRGIEQEEAPDLWRGHVLSVLEPQVPQQLFNFRFYLPDHPNLVEFSFDADRGPTTISRSAIIQPLLIAQVVELYSPSNIFQYHDKSGWLGDKFVLWEDQCIDAPELDFSIGFKPIDLPANPNVPRDYPFFFIRKVDTILDFETAPLVNLYHSSQALHNFHQCMARARRTETFFGKIRVFSCVLGTTDFEILMHRAESYKENGKAEDEEGEGDDHDMDKEDDMEVEDDMEIEDEDDEKDRDWIPENEECEDDDDDNEYYEYHEEDNDDNDDDEDDERDRVMEEIEFRYVSLGRYPTTQLYLRVRDILNQIAAPELLPRLQAALTKISREEERMSSLKRKFLTMDVA